MSSYTGQTIINRALINIGVLEQGGTPSVSDTNEGLARLNDMLGQWRIQNKFVWGFTSTAFALTANQATYPMGPAAAAPFNVPRPTFIEKASIQIQTGPIVPVQLFTLEQYRAITDLTAVAAYPQILYNDKASPSSNLILWPKPNVAAATNIILDMWNQILDFQVGGGGAPTVANELPDGYAEAIVNALAVRLMPMFGVAVNTDIGKLISSTALQAEAAIVELNTKARKMMLQAPAAPDAAAGGAQ